MAHPTRQSVVYPECFSKPIVPKFDQPSALSDGGGLLLGAVDRGVRGGGEIDGGGGALEEIRDQDLRDLGPTRRRTSPGHRPRDPSIKTPQRLRRPSATVGPGGVFSDKGGRSWVARKIPLIIRPPPPFRCTPATLRDRPRGPAGGGVGSSGQRIAATERRRAPFLLRSCRACPFRPPPSSEARGAFFSGEGERR